MSLTIVLDAEPIKTVRQVNQKYVASFCVGSVKNKATGKYEGGLWLQMWFDEPVNAWDKVTVSEGYLKATEYNGKPQVTLYPTQQATVHIERKASTHEPQSVAHDAGEWYGGDEAIPF